MTNLAALSEKIMENMGKVVVGKKDVIQRVLVTLFCGGHVLLEDIPGSGKTTMAKTLARSLSCAFSRVQFTPDLLPSDVTGLNFYNQKLQEFIFKKGPIFANVVLADEINRATPRTQSSLLECMEEKQITVDGTTYPLDQPFFVIATQNPVETQGTFPLPEAQLDRFFVKLAMGYPEAAEESAILERFVAAQPLNTIEPVATGEDLMQAMREVGEISVSPAVRDYVVALVGATRNNDKIRLGVSPRGSLALLRAAQAYAGISDRTFVTPDDVKAMAPAVLAHRIIARGYGFADGKTSNEELIAEILKSVPVPMEA